MTDTDWRVGSMCVNAGCVEVRILDGYVEVRQTDIPDVTVSFTPDEWAVFVTGVKAGEFDV